MSKHSHHNGPQVFDVSKPHKSIPSHTSKPVIVSHQVIENDPMLAAENAPALMNHSKPVLPIEIESHHEDSVKPEEPAEKPIQADSPAIESHYTPPAAVPPPQTQHEEMSVPADKPAEVEPFSGFTPSEPEAPTENKNEPTPESSTETSVPEPAPLPDELTKPAASDPIGLSSMGLDQPPTPEKTLDGGMVSLEKNNDPEHQEELPQKSENENNANQSENLPPVPEKIVDVEVLPIGHGAHSHFEQPKKRRWLVPFILLLIIGSYFAADAGVLGSGNVPIQLFKESETAGTAATVNSAATAQPPKKSEQNLAVPLGFSKYQLAGTPISFAYPTNWGAPTATSEPGFSKRGSGQQSDGTHSYIINFESKAEIQVVVTSSKFLSGTRPQQYYDFLSWCSGTHDGKIYQQKLLFATENKIDMPTTITCSEGPIAANKIDDKTIIQADARDARNNPIGDVYTMNLANSEFPVVRVKDVNRSNGEQIKELLGSLKLKPAD